MQHTMALQGSSFPHRFTPPQRLPTRAAVRAPAAQAEGQGKGVAASAVLPGGVEVRLASRSLGLMTAPKLLAGGCALRACGGQKQQARRGDVAGRRGSCPGGAHTLGGPWARWRRPRVLWHGGR